MYIVNINGITTDLVMRASKVQLSNRNWTVSYWVFLHIKTDFCQKKSLTKFLCAQMLVKNVTFILINLTNVLFAKANVIYCNTEVALDFYPLCYVKID